MAFQDYFSVVAFFIFLRETLEASVIIAVLLQCMNRTCPRLKRHVWWGAATGIILSIIAGGIFAAVWYLAKARLFQGNGKLIFQGVISYLACILITYLGFAMMRFGNLEKKYMRKLDAAARKAASKAEGKGGANGKDAAEAEGEGDDEGEGGKGGEGSKGGDAAVVDDGFQKSHAWSVFLLASTAVLREGIESVVFLAGVGSNTSFRALPLACLAGLVVGLAVGFAIYYGGRSIKDLKIFFIISTIVLFFIAAGQVSLGTQLLSKVGMFGYYAPWADELAWHLKPVADLSGCCSDEFAHGKQFFVLAHAVLGYQARPSPIILFLYCFYWVVVITFVIIKWRNGSLFDADYKRKRSFLQLRRKAAALGRALTRTNRRLNSLEGKAALKPGDAKLQAQLADTQVRQAQLQAQLAEAEAARDAEQQRLDEEDAELEAAVTAARAPRASAADASDDSGADSADSPAACALLSEGAGSSKDLEAGLPDQQPKRGWAARLRRNK